MRMILVIVGVLTASAAMAQQQPSAAQLAVQIDAAVGQMATTIDQQKATIEALQAQIKELQAKDKVEQKK